MRDFFWKILKWFLFKVDAETAHLMTCALIRLGIRLGNFPLRIMSGGDHRELEQAPKKTTVLGMEFASRVGLAAGFDKNAEIVRALPDLGFGFAEIGTVTPRPQPGNERPRLFRDPSRQALFNRMGFNGLGAGVVSQRLASAKEDLPSWFRVGVNLGKNKDTSLEGVAADYALAARSFEGLADYLVINVSSPNTPGLRSLQTVEALKPILEETLKVINGWSKKPPILLKLAPEVQGVELSVVIRALEAAGISGWVLTNTLAGSLRDLSGGWSGGPVRVEAMKRLQEARALTRLPIISVGGILTEEEALARISAGADLIQIYSGWIYGGPEFAWRLSRRLK